MIDLEQKIEEKLRHFQYLNGKGSVKHGNATLLEIIRLMMGMITRNRVDSPADEQPQPPPPLPQEPTIDYETVPDDEPAHVEEAVATADGAAEEVNADSDVDETDDTAHAKPKRGRKPASA